MEICGNRGNELSIWHPTFRDAAARRRRRRPEPSCSAILTLDLGCMDKHETRARDAENFSVLGVEVIPEIPGFQVLVAFAAASV